MVGIIVSRLLMSIRVVAWIAMVVSRFDMSMMVWRLMVHWWSMVMRVVVRWRRLMVAVVLLKIDEFL